MPTRLTHVRTSVRPRTTLEDDQWKSLQESWAHDHWDYFTILPLSGEELLRVARSDYDADWKARCRASPGVPDGAHLVTYVNGRAELVFEVRKSMRHGRYRVLHLKEIGPLQS